MAGADPGSMMVTSLGASEGDRKMVSDNSPRADLTEPPKHCDALLAGLVRCRALWTQLTVRYKGAKHNIPRFFLWRGFARQCDPLHRIRICGSTTPSRKLSAGCRTGTIAAAVEAEHSGQPPRIRFVRRWCAEPSRRRATSPIVAFRPTRGHRSAVTG